MARTTVRDRVTRLSCMDNMDVEALVTRYCIAIPHVYPIFPEHNHLFTCRAVRQLCQSGLYDWSNPHQPRDMIQLALIFAITILSDVSCTKCRMPIRTESLRSRRSRIGCGSLNSLKRK